MKKAKLEKVRKAGYRLTDTKVFLGLSDTEAALVELKIALTRRLRTLRNKKGVSQTALAKQLGSSQSRVAKMEAASADVSLDLIFKALLALGDSPQSLGRVLAEAA